jgi:hypothetical protein
MTRPFGIALLLVLLRPLVAPAQAGSPGLLCWQENRKLSWRDFQAKASALPKNSPLFASSGAHAAPELKVKGLIDSSGRNNFMVRAAFNPQRAWVRDSTHSTTTLLAHEQLHFDICELTARKLRARIAQVYASGADVFASKFTQQIQRMIAEEGVLHEAYDKETAHGIYEEKQAAWQTRISRELAALSPYKSTASTCYAD